MLWCYGEDHGSWGQEIVRRAVNRGMKADIFGPSYIPVEKGDHVFMRVPQWEPECSAGKHVAKMVRERGGILVPDYFTIHCYEDKLVQTQAYFDWMPTTHVIRAGESWRDARRYAEDLRYPFISKARVASASANVRLIRNEAEAQTEFEMAIEGRGYPIKIGKGRGGMQQGYLIWQKFCQGNECDYRAVITGRHIMMLRRFNKAGTPFASGSGVNEPVEAIDTVGLQELYDTAKRFFETYGLKWCGIDLVFDKDEMRWQILETTLGWSQTAYRDCVYFGTDYRGRDMFDLFLDELQAGVFG